MIVRPTAPRIIYVCAISAVIAAGTLGEAGAYAAIAVAILGFVTAAVGVWRWWRRKERRERASAFLHEGNELLVRFGQLNGPNDPALAALATDMDGWFAGLQRFIEERAPSALGVLRSDAGIAGGIAARNDAAFSPYFYFYAWLPQRISQLEKVLGQL